MTEEKEKEKKIYQPEEIHAMFDVAFLPKLQEFAQRTKKEMYPEEEIACFQVRMILEFSDLDAPLTYESINEKVNLQLQPVLQKDLDKARAEAEEQAEKEPVKDPGDE